MSTHIINFPGADIHTTTLTSVSNVSVGENLDVTSNLTVSGDAAVSGNATVSGNVEVGTANLFVDTTTGNVGVGTTEPTESLDIVGNLNLQKVSNTASIKLNSNVVTEFVRSKKLIKYPRVALTSAALNAYENGYKITYSRNGAGYPAWHPFDNDPISGNNFVGWYSGIEAGTIYNGTDGAYAGTTRLASETELGEWIGLEVPSPIKLYDVRIVSQSYSATSNTIDDLVIYAKKQSGDTWTNLGTFTGIAIRQGTVAGVTLNVNSSDYYKFFALVATKRVSAANGVAIRVLDFFGTPEYDPEADGTDVIARSVPNVPNTDWLEVYYDAKDLVDGAISTTAGAITGLGGTTNNGTAYGNPQISDGAFVFDGNGDYIETTLGSHISGDWTNTVSFWIAWNAIPTSGGQTPFMIGQPNTSTNGIGVDFNANGGMFYFTTNGDVVTIDNVFDLITPGKWIHFTFIHTPGGKYVYWDGKQVGIWTSGGAPTLPTSPTLSIGRRGSSLTNYINAKIANFRLFNRALTSDEIWQLYAYQKEYFGHGNLDMTLKAGRLGIGTSEPGAVLDVRGDILGGCPVYFAAYNSTGTSAGNTVIWDELWISRGGGYDTSTGIFTAPLAGIYKFYYTLRQLGSATTGLWARVQLNGSDISSAYGAIYLNTTRDQAGSTVLLKLNVGDEISVKVYNYNMASVYNSFVGEYFSSL